MKLILASQSPRRQELLKLFQLPFTVQVSDIDETMNPSLPAYDEVARISRKKAEAASRTPDDVVIAADTIVVCNGEILGKPKDAQDAFRMLKLLSGRDHQVMTGLTVLRGEKVITCTEVTDIYFRELTDDEIQRYIDSKEPMDNSGAPIWNNWRDKAGGYGIQEPFGAMATKRIVGDYYNVMGLPVCRLGMILRTLTEES